MVQKAEPIKRARVWVAGGRNYNGRARLYYVLDAYHEKHGIEMVITGAATGADQLALEWADERGISKTAVPANWSVEGRSAGPKRNRKIAAEFHPDVLIAFPGGRGTVDAVAVARENNIPVFEIDR